MLAHEFFPSFGSLRDIVVTPGLRLVPYRLVEIESGVGSGFNPVMRLVRDPSDHAAISAQHLAVDTGPSGSDQEGHRGGDRVGFAQPV